MQKNLEYVLGALRSAASMIIFAILVAFTITAVYFMSARTVTNVQIVTLPAEIYRGIGSTSSQIAATPTPVPLHLLQRDSMTIKASYYQHWLMLVELFDWDIDPYQTNAKCDSGDIAIETHFVDLDVLSTGRNIWDETGNTCLATKQWQVNRNNLQMVENAELCLLVGWSGDYTLAWWNSCPLQVDGLDYTRGFGWDERHSDKALLLSITLTHDEMETYLDWLREKSSHNSDYTAETFVIELKRLGGFNFGK